jgi:hypothetical protein
MRKTSNLDHPRDPKRKGRPAKMVPGDTGEVAVRPDVPTDAGSEPAGSAIVPWSHGDRPSPPAVETGPTASAVLVASANDLAALAEGIRSEHRQGVRLSCRSLDHFRRAGEALQLARARLEHGQFRSWVEVNCGFSRCTAANYMRLSRNWDRVADLIANVQGDAPLGLERALKAIQGPGRRPTRATEIRDPDPPAGGPHDLGHANLTIAPATGLPGETGRVAPEGRDEISDPTPAAPRKRAMVGPVGVELPGKTPAVPEDPHFRLKRLRLKMKLDEHGKRPGFDADARIWRLLRPVAEAILAHDRPDGAGYGEFSSLIASFIRARPPEEWDACPACDATGIVAATDGPCEACLGQGFRIWP